jgi:hypothetical protein
MRDRLLLAFADLRSFGIEAEPSVSGSITEATALIETEASGSRELLLHTTDMEDHDEFRE